MSDFMPLECPYCGDIIDEWYELFGYGAYSITVQCENPNCRKEYIVDIDYNAPDFQTEKAPCLNNGEHKYRYQNHPEKGKSLRFCTVCNEMDTIPTEEVPDDSK